MTASEKAHELLGGVRKFHDEWAGVAGSLTEAELRAPSALPDWSRAHVLSHLARNADGLHNLLTWANTGVETPMYVSDQARDDDIQAGARRAGPEIIADVVASAARFDEYAASMPDDAWVREARNRQGAPVTGVVVAGMRLSETAFHLADLDHGYDFERVFALLGPLAQDIVQHAVNARRAHLPPVRITVPGTAFAWATTDGPGSLVTGPGGAVMAWLGGRSDGAGLEGGVAKIPDWG